MLEKLKLERHRSGPQELGPFPIKCRQSLAAFPCLAFLKSLIQRRVGSQRQSASTQRKVRSSMTSDSKIFVGLHASRETRQDNQVPPGPTCQWDGCTKVGTQQAPVGSGAEGLYLLFCAEHFQRYASGYSYSPFLSDPEIARYQREAANGQRVTSGMMHRQATEVPLPSTAGSGSAKSINAGDSAAERQADGAAVQGRRPTFLEAKAFEALGLSPNATPEEIRKRYKQKLKMHHPDANRGDRNSEDELKKAIEAHKVLKLNGFC